MTSRLCAATLFLLAAALSLVSAPAARADQGETALSAWLTQCHGNRQPCLNWLISGLETAYDMEEICPPEGLSEPDAAEMEMRWLENAAASNAALARGRESDAEWTALHTLWPCDQ